MLLTRSSWIVVCMLALMPLIGSKPYAEEAASLWPDAKYDPAIPTFESVLGYSPGERITWHKDAMQYFKALARASSERVVITPYATSWEGRELYYVAISSARNIRRLDDIKLSMQALSDPRKTNRSKAQQLIQSTPAVTWLAYGVHGNEISSTDAAMLTAYHLLASKDDELVKEALENTVIVIDPLQNPDGRDRFIHHFEMTEGLLPDKEAISAEHHEPWPSSRTNHYLFDLNRDWFIQSQPETQGRVKALLEWYPVAFVDAHEMKSRNNTYFFAPDPEPHNPHLTHSQKNSLLLFGKNNARWFDRYGIDYFTREIFDSFYPGYGSSWPAYLGSVSMTYEQATSSGLVVRHDDGQELHYRDGVKNHFVASMATIETVASQHERFLMDFYNYRASAIEEGKQESVRTYLLPTQNDQAATNKLARLLVKQGIEVFQASSSFESCRRNYSAGTYIVRADQPAKRLVRTLLDERVPLSDDFMEKQEQRRARKQQVEIYDVTAWSLPLMFNVEMQTCKRAAKGDFDTVIGSEQPHADLAKAKVAYLVPWGQATAVKFLSGALRRGLNVKSADKAFTHRNLNYPAGSLVLRVAENPENIHSVINELAKATAVTPVAVNESWVTVGPNFGSSKVVNIPPLRIGIAWDFPVDAVNAGNTRFLIERQFDYPVSAIRLRQLKQADLSRYDVIILPAVGYAGDYTVEFGEEGAKRLKMWVERGGVLIGLGSALRFLADPEVDFLAIRRENASRDKSKIDSEEKPIPLEEKEASATVAGTNLVDISDFYQAVAPLELEPDGVKGVLVRARVDPDHWLSAGVASSLNVLVQGGDIYAPIRLDKGVNVARFEAPDVLVKSGYMWEENRQQLAYKPFVVAQAIGKGHVIGFTQNPTERGYMDGLNIIFMNAIFRGAAHAKPTR